MRSGQNRSWLSFNFSQESCFALQGGGVDDDDGDDDSDGDDDDDDVKDWGWLAEGEDWRQVSSHTPNGGPPTSLGLSS